MAFLKPFAFCWHAEGVSKGSPERKGKIFNVMSLHRTWHLYLLVCILLLARGGLLFT